MTEKNNTLLNQETLQRIVEGAIQSEIGRIDALPREVADLVRNVYGEFMPVYIEMIRTRDNHPQEWQPQVLVIDPEVVDDLQHFFSDYQRLSRRFKQINRQVKNLLKMDRRADPRRFQECVAEILSGGEGLSIMCSLVGE